MQPGKPGKSGNFKVWIPSPEIVKNKSAGFRKLYRNIFNREAVSTPSRRMRRGERGDLQSLCLLNKSQANH